MKTVFLISLGFNLALIFAFVMAIRRPIFTKNETNQIDVNRPKIKGDSSIMDIDADQIKKASQNKPKEADDNKKGIFARFKTKLKNRRSKK